MQKDIFRVRKQTAESSSMVHGERFYLTESIHTVKSTVLQSYRRPIQIFSALPDTPEACFQSPFVQGELKEWSLKVQTVTRKQWHGFTHTDETNTNAPEGLASTTKDESSVTYGSFPSSFAGVDQEYCGLILVLSDVNERNIFCHEQHCNK